MPTKKIDTFNKNQLRLKIGELEKVINDLKKQDGAVASCPVPTPTTCGSTEVALTCIIKKLDILESSVKKLEKYSTAKRSQKFKER